MEKQCDETKRTLPQQSKKIENKKKNKANNTLDKKIKDL